MPTFIVFDTNILERNLHPDREHWQMFRTIRKKLGMQVAVPWVVREELAAHAAKKAYATEINKATKIILEALNDMKRGFSYLDNSDASLFALWQLLQNKNFSPASKEIIKKSLTKRLEKSIGAAVLFLDLPDISHKETMDWCLEQKAPFTPRVVDLDDNTENEGTDESIGKPQKHKDAGYKDFLIWKTVRQLLQESDDNFVIFICQDGAFFESKTSHLHADLKDDLTTIPNGLERIDIFKSVSQFIEKHQDALKEIPMERIDFDDFDRLVWNASSQFASHVFRIVDPRAPARASGPVLLQVHNVAEVSKHVWLVRAECSQIVTLMGSVAIPGGGGELPLPEVHEARREQVALTFDSKNFEVTNVEINGDSYDEVVYLDVQISKTTAAWEIRPIGPVQMNLSKRTFPDYETANFCVRQVCSAQNWFIREELQTIKRVPVALSVLEKWGFIESKQSTG